MTLDSLINPVKDALTVRRVFAEPYERDGATVILAASVAGGGGGGSGHDDEGQEGEGGGFGVQARPAGAYVIRDGDVSWRPAVDANKLIGAVTLVVVVLAVARVRLTKLRLKGS